MKTSGLIRKVDDLGRVVLPVEYRRMLNISLRDPLEIYAEGDRIILKKTEESCVFCGSRKDLEYYKERPVCADCLAELRKG